MKWFIDFLHMPMLWDVILPVSAVIIVCLVVTWESIYPAKKLFHKIPWHPHG